MRNDSSEVPQHIPSKEDWGSLEDLDVKYAYGLYGGKSVSEALSHFRRNPIERADELLFASLPVFQFYIYCFVELLKKPEQIEKNWLSDTPSNFLNLLIGRAKRDRLSVWKIYSSLLPVVENTVKNQKKFGSSVEVYGSFAVKKGEIETLIGWGQ